MLVNVLGLMKLHSVCVKYLLCYAVHTGRWAGADPWFMCMCVYSCKARIFFVKLSTPSCFCFARTYVTLTRERQLGCAAPFGWRRVTGERCVAVLSLWSVSPSACAGLRYSTLIQRPKMEWPGSSCCQLIPKVTLNSVLPPGLIKQSSYQLIEINIRQLFTIRDSQCKWENVLELHTEFGCACFIGCSFLGKEVISSFSEMKNLQLSRTRFCSQICRFLYSVKFWPSGADTFDLTVSWRNLFFSMKDVSLFAEIF